MMSSVHKRLNRLAMAFLLLFGLLPAGLFAGATQVAHAYDPNANLLASAFDTTFTTGSNPFTVLSANTGGVTSAVYLSGGNRAIEFRDTTAYGSGGAGNSGSAFAVTVSTYSALVQRINQVYNMPVGSDPVQFVFEFKAARTAASDGPVPSGIQAYIEFVNHDNGVTIPRFPTGQPSIYNTAAYSHVWPVGGEVAATVNDQDVPGLRFVITPNGGSRNITSLKLGFGVRVNTSATDEAFAVDDLAVYEAAPIVLPPPPGLIAHWSFEQSVGGAVYDQSGHNHTATLVGGLITPQGRVGNGLYLNGTSDYADAGPASDYALTDALTAAFWVKPEEQATSRHRFLNALDSSGGFQLGFEDYGRRLFFSFKNAATGAETSTYVGITTHFGKWMHIAMTWDKSSGLINLYVNGQFVGRAAFNSSLPVPASHLLIGTDGRYYDKGAIDELKLYNYAMAAAEIQQLYNDLPNIPVTGVTLSKTTDTIAVGSTDTLDYTIAPDHAKNMDVAWISSDPDVATIDGFGKVTAKKAGTTVITVTTADGGYTASCTVQVYVQHPTGVTLNKTSTAIAETKTEQIVATVAPSNTTDKSVTWSSSDPTVATVDTNGIVRGIHTGTATVTATTNDGGYTASLAVTVTKTAVTSIALNKTSTTITAGVYEKLSATVLPSTATYKTAVVWSSSNPVVAEVDQTGMVVAKGAGQATIAATAADGGIAATCTVTVPSFGAGIWSQVFVLRDYLNDYDFPEELIRYDLTFPANTVKRNGLKLTSPSGAVQAYELSNVLENVNGYLNSATIAYRAGLNRNAISGFRLDYDPAYDYASQSVQQVAVQDNNDHTATISANLQQIKVPYGTVAYSGGADPSTVNAPILSVARDGQTWAGTGSFLAPSGIKVQSVAGQVLEQGPLSLKYQVQYAFSGNRTYTVVLTVRHNDKYVTVDETMSGFLPTDEAYFKFSMLNGIDPDGRLAMTLGGYNAPNAPIYSGSFTGNVSAGGKLPFEVGLYSVNAGGVIHSAAFWKDSGPNGIVFATNRSKDWKLSKRFIYSEGGPQNLSFYSSGGDKYMKTRLEGAERHWALGLIDRNEVVVTGMNGANAGKSWLANSAMSGYANGWGAGPDVRLAQKLGDYSLNRYKNMTLDWNDDVARRLDLPGTDAGAGMSANQTVTFANWVAFKRYNWDSLADRYWDVGNLSGRGMRNIYAQYANSRWSWAPDERQQARALLAFYAYVEADDNGYPYISMLAGHPNFVMDEKQVLGVAVGAFPEHPQAAEWRNDLVGYFNEWVNVFSRRDNAALGTIGGRWYENAATYSLASMRPALAAYQGIKNFDGTDIFDNDNFRQWVAWNIGILVPTEGGNRQLPAQGAHAMDKDLPGGEFDNVFAALSGVLRQSANPANVRLGNELLWSLSNGAQGTNPNLQSTLYTDYGAVMRYDYGGPHEAYVNLQQLNGSGYRWSTSTNGLVYYASKGKRWSWNDAETSGDSINLNLLPVLTYNNGAGSLGAHAVDGVLYNFDFAQFYKAAGNTTPYASRSVMMLRDDYISIYDDMADATQGTFNWNNSGYNFVGEQPQIYTVKGGAGDQMHLVAPNALSVAAKSYGAQVGAGEYVFTTGSNEAALDVTDGTVVFKGKAGYAGDSGLALFDGTKIGLGGFILERTGGDFGFSAKESDSNHIAGRIAGRSGGTVSVTLPGDFNTNSLTVAVAGSSVPFTLSGGVVTFNVAIAPSDGYKSYTIASSNNVAVANGGFETGTATTADNWSKTNWVGSPDYARVSDVVYAGSYAVRIANAANANGGFTKSGTTMIGVTPGQSYTIGMMAKTSGVSAGTAEGAYLSVQFCDSGGAALGTAVTSIPLNGTADWTANRVSATAPAGGTQMRIDVRLKGTGTAWFDDVTVTLS